MLEVQFLSVILEHVQQEEIKRGTKIDKIYIVGGQYYFDEWQVDGKSIDYTLIRGDEDEKHPTYLNTEVKLKGKRREGF